VLLNEGEIVIDVPATEVAWDVQAGKRTVSGRAARFAVTAAGDVLVLHGKVEISDLKNPLTGGQQLAAGRDRPEPATRLTQRLAWMRDTLAAETPLVPGSEHAGGALVARDSSGRDVPLSLRKYHVDLHVEDGFARTTIDQTYFNHEPSQLEGTFYFP